MIHGFTGSTQSMYYLAEAFAQEGFTVMAPRLTGHGINPEAMEKASYMDWMQDVESALHELDQICEQMFVVGLSMGGALTLFLGQNYPLIQGLILVNTAIDMPKLLKEYHEKSSENIRFVDGIGSDIKADNITELAYKQTPVKSMSDILQLMSIVREDLPKVKMPTLIFSSTVDHVVPPSNSMQIYETISSLDKAIISLENSYHVATLDNDKTLIAQKSIEFIHSVSDE